MNGKGFRSGWPEFSRDHGKSGLPVRNPALELLGLQVIEDFPEVWAGFESKGDEIMSGYKGGGNQRFTGEFLGLAVQEFDIVEHAVAAGAVHTVEFEFLLIRGAGHESFQLGSTHVLDIHEIHVIADHGAYVFNDLVGIA